MIAVRYLRRSRLRGLDAVETTLVSSGARAAQSVPGLGAVPYATQQLYPTPVATIPSGGAPSGGSFVPGVSDPGSEGTPLFGGGGSPPPPPEDEPPTQTREFVLEDAGAGSGGGGESFVFDDEGRPPLRNGIPVPDSDRIVDVSPDIAPRGGFVKTWGPPLLFVGVVGGLVYWLRK